MANTTYSLAWQVLGVQFSTIDIDQILMTGDRMYMKSIHENRVNCRYLLPKELTKVYEILGHTLHMDDPIFVCNVLYSANRFEMDKAIESLSGILDVRFCQNIL